MGAISGSEFLFSDSLIRLVELSDKGRLGDWSPSISIAVQGLEYRVFDWKQENVFLKILY